MASEKILRIGTLGAARITPMALVRPARKVPEVTVHAVAARNATRARAFARKHRVPVVHPSYEALIADPDVDAVYNPLPNSLHAEWTLAALAAGKHVLCEKPLTANAAEAEQVAAAARRAGRVVMEAFHYRYHPLTLRARALLDEGILGPLRHVETWMCFPLPMFSDIRYQFELAGGATMDAGCYAIHLLRVLAGQEPETLDAKALLQRPQVDRAMTARFRFPGGATGKITASMWSTHLFRMSARVTGERGELRLFNFVFPHVLGALSVRTRDRRWRETGGGETTYFHQLRAFADAALHGGPVLTPPSDSVANMKVIDDVYRSAGLSPRGAPQSS